jgi:hypothetical protein
MAFASEQRENLEEVVRLLKSVREGIGRMDKPDFDDGRVDAHVVTALSAARAALNLVGQREDRLGVDEPGR